nr:TonB-dependent receptor [Mucilaginibacter sp. Bleaf8]
MVGITQQFKNTYGVKHQFSAYPGQNLQFTFGNTKTYNNEGKLGYIASVTYGNNFERFYRTRDNYDRNGNQTFSFNDVLYNTTTNLGALFNIAYSYKNSKYSLKNLFNNSFSNNFTERQGLYNESSDETSQNIANIRGFQTEVTQNGLLSSVFEGQHFLPESKINIDYNVSYGYSYRNQPDQRIALQTQRPNSGDPRWFIDIPGFNQPAIQHAGRLFSDLKENIYGGRFNISAPYQLFNQTNKVKAGVLANYRDRNFSIDALGYALAPGFSKGQGSNFYESDGWTLENIFSSSSIAQNRIVLNTINDNSFGYNGKVDLQAGYLMTENKFGDQLKMILGARVERYSQKILPYNPARLTQKYTNTDILPSLNLVYAINTKSNVRFAASQTVNRPELRELASFLYYDFVTDFVVTGNPNLKRSLNTNLDLRYELFPDAGQIFSVSAFYKKFSNAIEQTNQGNNTFSFANAANAYDYGAEIEFRRRLNFFDAGAFFNNLTFYANASVIQSRVKIPASELDREDNIRPLQGQSPYILNGGLTYVGAKSGLGVNLLYNRIGQRLAFVGQNGGLDTYEKPRDLVDFQISKRVIKSKGEIKLNVSDIFAQKIRLYYNYDSKTTFDSTNDRTIQATKPGRNISLQFIYNF